MSQAATRWTEPAAPVRGAGPQLSLHEPSAPRHQGAALALILAVAFMVVLDFSIVNVALAAIERELHAGTTAVQWVITAYAITFGGLLVLGGRVGDLFGRRRMFVAGLVLFSLASLGGGLATSVTMLIAARAVQGVGAALVAPAALSLITTSTAEGAPRNRALGYYGAVASIGFVAGLVAGGVLVQYFDWRSVLWVNVPIGLLAAVLAPVLISDAPPASRRQRLDLGGAALVTGSIASLVYGVSEGPDLGWTSATTLGALVGALVLAAAFVAVEQRHPAPLVRLGMLGRRGLRSANLAMVLLGAWSAGELLTVPLFFQLVLHYSALTTGLAMAPQGIVGFLGASRGAKLVRRVGVRTLLLVSAVAAGLGLLGLGLSFATHDYLFFLPGFLLAGFGTATSAFGATVAATQGVADGEQGLAGGLINMSRQVGAAVGVALTAAIIGTGAASGGSVGPDRSSLLVVGAFGLLAAVVVGRGISSRLGQGRVAETDVVAGIRQGVAAAPRGPREDRRAGSALAPQTCAAADTAAADAVPSAAGTSDDAVDTTDDAVDTTDDAGVAVAVCAPGGSHRSRARRTGTVPVGSAVRLYRIARCRIHQRRRAGQVAGTRRALGGGHVAPLPARIL